MPESSNKKRGSESDRESRPGRRPAWSGTISFGLVSVPVELYPATRPRKLRARMLDEDGTPLSRRYFCPADEQDLDADDLVRGYELPNGEYVTVEDEELEQLAPKKSREIDLRLFTKEDQLSPAWFEQAYVLVPREEGGKAYRLLAEVMHHTGRVGIATFVMRAREYIIAIFSDGHVLLGQTLRFADELRSPDDLDLPEADEKIPAAKLAKIEHALGRGREQKLKPRELVDPGHAKLEKLIEVKRKKGDVVKPAEASGQGETESSGAEVIDLMELLKNSLKGDKQAKPKKSSSGRRRS